MQARLVVITATFTYDAKSSATPTQRPAGESNPGVFCKHVSFSPCSRCKRKSGLSIQACYLCQRCSFPPTTQGGVPALLLAGVLAPSRAAQWGLIYEPRSSGRYLPALFTKFSSLYSSGL